MTLPRFVVSCDVLTGAHALLSGPELHHLRVRRLQVGSPLVLTDQRGRERTGVVAEIGRHQAVIRLDGAVRTGREATLNLTLAQAALKGDKLDFVVEKATELGVIELLIVSSERSIAHPSVARFARWNRLARGAAKQSQRTVVPGIAGPVSIDEVLSRPATLRLMFWEEAPQLSLAALRPPHVVIDSALVLVGPEGGFSRSEAHRAATAGFHLVTLGPRILRAETAALAAITLCQFLWGDLGAARG